MKVYAILQVGSPPERKDRTHVSGVPEDAVVGYVLDYLNRNARALWDVPRVDLVGVATAEDDPYDPNGRVSITFPAQPIRDILDEGDMLIVRPPATLPICEARPVSVPGPAAHIAGADISDLEESTPEPSATLPPRLGAVPREEGAVPAQARPRQQSLSRNEREQRISLADSRVVTNTASSSSSARSSGKRRELTSKDGTNTAAQSTAQSRERKTTNPIGTEKSSKRRRSTPNWFNPRHGAASRWQSGDEADETESQKKIGQTRTKRVGSKRQKSPSEQYATPVHPSAEDVLTGVGANSQNHKGSCSLRLLVISEMQRDPSAFHTIGANADFEPELNICKLLKKKSPSLRFLRLVDKSRWEIMSEDDSLKKTNKVIWHQRLRLGLEERAQGQRKKSHAVRPDSVSIGMVSGRDLLSGSTSGLGDDEPPCSLQKARPRWTDEDVKKLQDSFRSSLTEATQKRHNYSKDCLLRKVQKAHFKDRSLAAVREKLRSVASEATNERNHARQAGKRGRAAAKRRTRTGDAGGRVTRKTTHSRWTRDDDQTIRRVLEEHSSDRNQNKAVARLVKELPHSRTLSAVKKRISQVRGSFGDVEDRELHCSDSEAIESTGHSCSSVSSAEEAQSPRTGCGDTKKRQQPPEDEEASDYSKHDSDGAEVGLSDEASNPASTEMMNRTPDGDGAYSRDERRILDNVLAEDAPGLRSHFGASKQSIGVRFPLRSGHADYIDRREDCDSESGDLKMPAVRENSDSPRNASEENGEESGESEEETAGRQTTEMNAHALTAMVPAEGDRSGDGLSDASSKPRPKEKRAPREENPSESENDHSDDDNSSESEGDHSDDDHSDASSKPRPKNKNQWTNEAVQKLLDECKSEANAAKKNNLICTEMDIIEKVQAIYFQDRTPGGIRQKLRKLGITPSQITLRDSGPSQTGVKRRDKNTKRRSRSGGAGGKRRLRPWTKDDDANIMEVLKESGNTSTRAEIAERLVKEFLPNRTVDAVKKRVCQIYKSGWTGDEDGQELNYSSVPAGTETSQRGCSTTSAAEEARTPRIGSGKAGNRQPHGNDGVGQQSENEAESSQLGLSDQDSEDAAGAERVNHTHDGYSHRPDTVRLDNGHRSSGNDRSATKSNDDGVNFDNLAEEVPGFRSQPGVSKKASGVRIPLRSGHAEDIDRLGDCNNEGGDLNISAARGGNSTVSSGSHRNVSEVRGEERVDFATDGQRSTEENTHSHTNTALAPATAAGAGLSVTRRPLQVGNLEPMQMSGGDRKDKEDAANVLAAGGRIEWSEAIAADNIGNDDQGSSEPRLVARDGAEPVVRNDGILNANAESNDRHSFASDSSEHTANRANGNRRTRAEGPSAMVPDEVLS